ncbi:hypothetical protein Glove_408g21 [Diversispora epigaea]|uniref:Uncharacterized protein n=1 Tax=Diversispora epigaea TaxID=1348612 RepID=A0A397H2Y1_9GLOM|nr:hypothetical protein Glove_408g21 [Diversispora epigaea]
MHLLPDMALLWDKNLDSTYYYRSTILKDLISAVTIASLPYELMTGVTLDEYFIKTDKYNVKGFWEWKNNTVRVIEFPSSFHEDSAITTLGEFIKIFDRVNNTPARMKVSGATRSRTHGGEMESFDLFLNLKCLAVDMMEWYEHQPWLNLIIQVAYAEEELHLKNKVENYWLLPNRAHDVIAIKIDYIPNNAIPTEMTVSMALLCEQPNSCWCARPVMYEFGTINRQGVPISILPGQCVINISLECIYYEMPRNFVIPSPPLPNPIPIDLFEVRINVLNP